MEVFFKLFVFFCFIISLKIKNSIEILFVETQGKRSITIEIINLLFWLLTGQYWLVPFGNIDPTTNRCFQHPDDKESVIIFSIFSDYFLFLFSFEFLLITILHFYHHNYQSLLRHPLSLLHHSTSPQLRVANAAANAIEKVYSTKWKRGSACSTIC